MLTGQDHGCTNAKPMKQLLLLLPLTLFSVPVQAQQVNQFGVCTQYQEVYQPGGYDQYAKLLATFIRDVRKDLSAPKLPFVIGVIGVNGETELYGPEQKRYRGIHQNIRDAMAAPAASSAFTISFALLPG